MANTEIKIDCSDEKQLCDAKNIILQGNQNNVVLDLSKINFLLPEQSVHIRCLIDLCKENLNVGNRSIILPVGEDAKNYAGRIGLFDKTDYNYPLKKHDSNKFFSLHRIDSDSNDDLREQFITIFSNMKIPKNYCADIADNFVEIADNVYFHSGQKYKTGWGYACAQIIKNQIHIAVCDVGIGFYNSYKNNGTLKNRTEEQILKDSINELVSSLNDPVRGIGLFEAKEFIQRHGNCLEIKTGNYKLCVSKENINVLKLDNFFDGAIIKMEVPVV